MLLDREKTPPASPVPKPVAKPVLVNPILVPACGSAMGSKPSVASLGKPAVRVTTGVGGGGGGGVSVTALYCRSSKYAVAFWFASSVLAKPVPTPNALNVSVLAATPVTLTETPAMLPSSVFVEAT